MKYSSRRLFLQVSGRNESINIHNYLFFIYQVLEKNRCTIIVENMTKTENIKGNGMNEYVDAFELRGTMKH